MSGVFAGRIKPLPAGKQDVALMVGLPSRDSDRTHSYTKLRQGDYTILPNGDKVLHFPVVDRHPADLDSPFARFEFEYASKELLMAKGKIGSEYMMRHLRLSRETSNKGHGR